MAAKKHDFTATEFKAGAMVLVSAVILALFVAVLQGLRPPVPQKHFYTLLPDTKGLNKGAAVRFGGAKVGKVTSISVSKETGGASAGMPAVPVGEQATPAEETSPEAINAQPKEGETSGEEEKPQPRQIRIDFSVDLEVPVNELSEALITSVSLTAEKHLEVSTGSENAPLLADGARIKSRPGDLFEQADLIASQVRSLLAKVDRLMGIEDRPASAHGEAAAATKGEVTSEEEGTPAEEASGKVGGEGEPKSAGKDALITVAQISRDVHKVLDRGNDLLGEAHDMIAENKDGIKDIIKKVNKIEDDAIALMADLKDVVSENRPRIKSTMDHAGEVAANVKKLSERLEEIRSALQGTLDNAKSLSGSAKELVEENRPELEDLILDLRETVRNMKNFSATIAEQPQSVVRGKVQHGRE